MFYIKYIIKPDFVVFLKQYDLNNDYYFTTDFDKKKLFSSREICLDIINFLVKYKSRIFENCEVVSLDA